MGLPAPNTDVGTIHSCITVGGWVVWSGGRGFLVLGGDGRGQGTIQETKMIFHPYLSIKCSVWPLYPNLHVHIFISKVSSDESVCWNPVSGLRWWISAVPLVIALRMRPACMEKRPAAFLWVTLLWLSPFDSELKCRRQLELGEPVISSRLRKCEASWNSGDHRTWLYCFYTFLKQFKFVRLKWTRRIGNCHFNFVIFTVFASPFFGGVVHKSGLLSYEAKV